MTAGSPMQGEYQAVPTCRHEGCDVQTNHVSGVCEHHRGRVVSTEFGRQVNCAANGCEVPHSDDGEVYEWPLRDFGIPDIGTPVTVNGHICTWVTRTVTTSPWEVVDA